MTTKPVPDPLAEHTRAAEQLARARAYDAAQPAQIVIIRLCKSTSRADACVTAAAPYAAAAAFALAAKAQDTHNRFAITMQPAADTHEILDWIADTHEILDWIADANAPQAHLAEELARRADIIDRFESTTGLMFEANGPDPHDCPYCGKLVQFRRDHECYGTAGEDHDARMMDDRD